MGFCASRPRGPYRFALHRVTLPGIVGSGNPSGRTWVRSVVIIGNLSEQAIDQAAELGHALLEML